MKKSLVIAFGMFIMLVGVMSCGDGGADEARQKAIADSLRNDSIMKADAAAAAELAMLDSLENVRIADSIRAAFVADSIANSAKPGWKPKPKPAPAPAPTPTPTPAPTPKPLPGKAGIKGGTTTPTSGKDAIKGNTTTPKSGKDAIKGNGG